MLISRLIKLKNMVFSAQRVIDSWKILVLIE